MLGELYQTFENFRILLQNCHSFLKSWAIIGTILRIDINLDKILCYFRSEKFHKQQAKEQAQREANSPMKNCVLKFDHFENIHR